MADTPSDSSATAGPSAAPIVKLSVVPAPKRPSTRASSARHKELPLPDLDLLAESPVLTLPIVKGKLNGPPRKVGRPRKTPPVSEPMDFSSLPVEAEPEPASTQVFLSEANCLLDNLATTSTSYILTDETVKMSPVNPAVKITTITSTKTVIPAAKKTPAKFPVAPTRTSAVIAPPSSPKPLISSAPISLVPAPKKYTSIVNTSSSFGTTSSKIDKVPPGTAVSIRKSDFVPSVSREDDETLMPSKDMEFISVILPSKKDLLTHMDSKRDEYVIKKPLLHHKAKTSGLLDNVDFSKAVSRPNIVASSGCIVVPPHNFTSAMPAHVAAKLASPLGKTPGLIPFGSVGSVLSKFANTSSTSHETSHALPSITVLTTPSSTPSEIPAVTSSPSSSSMTSQQPEKLTIKIPPSPSSTISLSVPLTGSYLDDTIEEVSKGHFKMRALDSDSTLTASETEALEGRGRMESPNSKKYAAKKKRPVAQLTGEVKAATLPLDRLVAISEEAKKRLKLDFTALPPKKSTSVVKKHAIDVPPSIAVSSPHTTKKETLTPIPTTAKPTKAFPLRISTEGILTSFIPSTSSTATASGIVLEKVVEKRAVIREESLLELKPAVVDVKKPFHFIKADFSDDDQNSMDAHGFDWTSPNRPGKDTTTTKTNVATSTATDVVEEREKGSTRKARSLSIASDMTEEAGSMSVVSTAMDYEPQPVAHVEEKESIKKRKKVNVREAYKIGSAPLTDLGRWKPQDDMLLIVAVQEYRDLAMVHKHVKFSCHFTAIEIQERWFNLLYNKKISKAACQAVRSSPSDIVADVQRKSPFSEAEEALLIEIPVLSEYPEIEVFEIMLEANPNVFPPFRFAEDLEKHWRVMLAEGRIENCDTLCVIPDEQIAFNGDRLPCFAEMEGRIKDVDLKNWIHVTGEFAYEMDKIQRQNRERMMILDTEIHHLRFLVEKTLNYQLPDCGRPDFFSVQDRAFLAVLIGQRAKFGIKSGKVSYGRSCGGHVVDVNLSLEGYAGKLSRTQGYIFLERNASFRIENHGRRPVFVNQAILNYGDSCTLTDESMIEVGDVCVQFYMNHSRVNRYLRQKYSGEYLSDEEPIDYQERDRRPKSTKIVRKLTKSSKSSAYEQTTTTVSENSASDSGSVEKVEQEQASGSNRSLKGRTKKTGKSLLATVLFQESSAAESSGENSDSRPSSSNTPRKSKAIPMEDVQPSQDEDMVLQIETPSAFFKPVPSEGPLPPASSLGGSRFVLDSPSSQMAALNAVNDLLLQAQRTQPRPHFSSNMEGRELYSLPTTLSLPLNNDSVTRLNSNAGNDIVD